MQTRKRKRAITEKSALENAVKKGDGPQVRRMVEGGQVTNADVARVRAVAALANAVERGDVDRVRGMVHSNADIVRAQRVAALANAVEKRDVARVRGMVANGHVTEDNAVRAARRLHLAAMGRAVEKNDVLNLGRMVENEKTFVTKANVEKARRHKALRQAALEVALRHRADGHMSSDLGSLAHAYPTNPGSNAVMQANADAWALALILFQLYHGAREEGLHHRVEYLMGKPVPPRDFDKTQNLLWALKDPNILRLLLARSRRDLLDAPELVFAAMSRKTSHEAALGILLKARPKLVEARKVVDARKTYTPLQASASIIGIEDEHPSAFHTLLSAGADETVKDNANDDATVLHMLIMTDINTSRRRKILELLEARPNALNAVDNDGNTPLRLSLLIENNAATEILVHAGAKNLREKDKPPLFHVAVGSDEFHPNTVPLLLRAGANINAVNKNGKTPLHKSASVNQWTSGHLLQHGAKVDILDSNGRTALHHALEESSTSRWHDPSEYNPHIIRLLVAGSNPHVRDHFGKTPFDVSLRNSDKQHWVEHFKRMGLQVPKALI